MSELDRDTLRTHLPDLFDFDRTRGQWDAEWIVVAVDDAESHLLDHVEAELDFGEVVPTGARRPPRTREPYVWPDGIRLPSVYTGEAAQAGAVPGAPDARAGYPPPPDALAFYLPFHYFPEDVWGSDHQQPGRRRDGGHHLVAHSRAQAPSLLQAAYAARLFLMGARGLPPRGRELRDAA